MYSTKRAIVVLCLAIATQFGLASTATATYLMGSDVEVLETILAAFGLFALGIIGTCFGFIRWFLKRWNPKQLDPETLILIAKLMNNPDTRPFLEKAEVDTATRRQVQDLEKIVKRLAEAVGTNLADERLKADWDR